MSARTLFFAAAGVAVMVLTHQAVSASQATAKSIWDGVYTDDQAKRAEPLYAEKCANCHGDTLTGNDAPPLVGAEFSANWTDLNLNDLSERIRLTMPADSAGSLSRQQVVDIIALMLKHAEIPAGQAELAATADTLKGIKYIGSRPTGR